MASERSIRCLSCFATRSASATPRSAAASGQTAAGADVPRPTTARNSTHVSPAVRRSLLSAAANSSATSRRFSWAQRHMRIHKSGVVKTQRGRLVMPGKKLGQYHQFANGCPHEAVEEKRRRRQELLAPFSKRVEKDSQKRIPVFSVNTRALGYRTRESS